MSRSKKRKIKNRRKKEKSANTKTLLGIGVTTVAALGLTLSSGAQAYNSGGDAPQEPQQTYQLNQDYLSSGGTVQLRNLDSPFLQTIDSNRLNLFLSPNITGDEQTALNQTNVQTTLSILKGLDLNAQNSFIQNPQGYLDNNTWIRSTLGFTSVQDNPAAVEGLVESIRQNMLGNIINSGGSTLAYSWD